jgi:cell division septum initiation protein DivIVA
MDSAKITEKLKSLNVNLDDYQNDDITRDFHILFQIIEELQAENRKLESSLEAARDEIERLKGNVQPLDKSGNKKDNSDLSSENERKKRNGQPKNKNSKAKKKDVIEIDRIEICKIDKDSLPADAEFKGHQEYVVQEIIIKTDNVKYLREVYWSYSEKKTYIAELPIEIRGEFGPGVKSMAMIQKHVCNMSEPKIEEFFQNVGIKISQSTISRILTKGDDVEIFHQEKVEIFKAGLVSTPYQQIDGTGAKVNGEKHHVQIICNPYYSIYFTLPHKDRLSILDILLCGTPRQYFFNEEALNLLGIFRLSSKLIDRIQGSLFGKIIDENRMQAEIEALFPDPGSGKNSRLRIMEAGAIAYYHAQTETPVVQRLLSDNGPEYKRITEEQGLCWIHEGRIYKKLKPVVPLYQDEVDKFLNDYWDYYEKLLYYKDNPTLEMAQSLSLEFDQLFSRQTIYAELNERIKKTKAKKSELLLVLKYPELPLHNNMAELGARAQARKRDVSLHTITEEGTKSQDTFLTIAQTAKKLGVSAYKFIKDRISRKFEMPSLASLIPQIESSPQIILDSS